MLCSDIYRDYEADYSAASGAEEEEEGWKQREEDEEEGSGKLFTSSQHAFACYPHVRFLLNPRTAAHGTVVSPQAVVPLPHPPHSLEEAGFFNSPHNTEVLPGETLWISPLRKSFHR